MDPNRPEHDDVFRHLHDAIERVRRDVAEVEFWADAAAEFAKPVPDYKPDEMSVWIPPEQAAVLKRSGRP